MSGQLSELYARALSQETKDVIKRLAQERDEYKKLWELDRKTSFRDRENFAAETAKLRAELDEYRGMIDALETPPK